MEKERTFMGEVERLAEGISGMCSYEYLRDGKPVNPGKLLAKHGGQCKWSIRDKDWSVQQTKSGVVVEWVTQGESDAACLEGMFNDLLVELGMVPDYKLVVKCTSRDKLDFDNPEVTLEWSADEKRLVRRP